ncbi:cobalamin synthesis protein, P47K [Methanolobus psychrophilus R15]|nr:cobalamin synthesis protein, P47K [Methanolobus psychrophilus R15]
MDAIVIGGFLGSGKTTTVINVGKSLAERGHSVAIIVNEVGEVGIDGDIISKYGLDTKEITNGCICCTLKLNMKTTLTELRNSYNPDFIIVEPSGIAFPNVIKQNLELMNFGESIKVAPLVTLIDGSRFKDIMKSVKNYAVRQIEDAEILVINKVDLIDPIRVPILEESVQQLNRKAKVLKMSSREEDEGFYEMMKLIAPLVIIRDAPDHTHAEATVTPANSFSSEIALPVLNSPGGHTHYDSRSSGLASYANDYRILEEDIGSEKARSIAMDIAAAVKSAIMQKSPEFVGHIKMFLESPRETVKISITSYAEDPVLDIIRTASGNAPRFKILTAVSGMEEDGLIKLVDESVKTVFSRNNMLSQRLHEPHDHGHDHDNHDHHDHDENPDHHQKHHHKLPREQEVLDDIYDHDLVNSDSEGTCHL